MKDVVCDGAGSLDMRYLPEGAAISEVNCPGPHTIPGMAQSSLVRFSSGVEIVPTGDFWHLHEILRTRQQKIDNEETEAPSQF